MKKKYHDGFSDEENDDVDIKKMKEERHQFRSKKPVVVEAKIKTKHDNMRNFFVKMPSYQEFVSKSNCRENFNCSDQSKGERGNCVCKNIMIIDNDLF